MSDEPKDNLATIKESTLYSESFEKLAQSFVLVYDMLLELPNNHQRKILKASAILLGHEEILK